MKVIQKYVYGILLLLILTIGGIDTYMTYNSLSIVAHWLLTSTMKFAELVTVGIIISTLVKLGNLIDRKEKIETVESNTKEKNKDKKRAE